MQGQLFSQDFLLFGIKETPPWQALGGAEFQVFVAELERVFAGLDANSVRNEAQTEQLLIEPLLLALGWGDGYLPQVNLSAKRREDVPDILLFPDTAARDAALTESKDDRRYRHGVAILEAKRWLRPLDRGADDEPLDPSAPSSQMLRYLSRAELASERAVKWGLLSNGGVWRLYWQDARSRAEEFFEIELAALLAVPGVEQMPGEAAAKDRTQGLKLFYLLFNRAAFLPQAWDTESRSFHAYARNEARAYEERVSQDLGARVFDDIFPTLAQALAAGDLHAQTEKVGYGQFTRQRYTTSYLEEVREATLVLLYRLLFLFYAEDRRLLPIDDPRYRAYSVRRLREEVRDKTDAGAKWSVTMMPLWLSLQGVFQLINDGEDGIGMPAYNGGLFNRGRSPLLERTRVFDVVMAPIIDQLSRRIEEQQRGWINYRDLSVSHLGGIYERLLEYSLVHEVQAADDYHDKPEISRVVARPSSFARKVSGSYYTHNDLVQLILRESVGLLIANKHTAFGALIKRLSKKASLGATDEDTLNAADPASNVLELKICDPAMGSGHFLVALVDFMADAVLEAQTRAALAVAELPGVANWIESGRPWQSPVVARVAHIRRGIKNQATQHGWSVSDAQLDDRHIIRRMVLKKSIFGVDKNLMAVELAKTSLWLHTFTVGAPLSFLDHHLKHGDSLHGEQLPDVQRSLQSLGMLFQQSEMARLESAARNLGQVADLTDVDIAEARLSKKLADEADAQVAPLHGLLDFWRAMRWLYAAWPPQSSRTLIKLGDDELRLALSEILSPQRNLVATLGAGQLDGKGAAVVAANALLARVRALAQREKFLHWRTAFPTAFATTEPGFDAVIGNPPWDRIKLQEVEWFAERDASIAAQPRAADRKNMIAALRIKQAPLAADYDLAIERAEAHTRVLAKSGDYPLLGGGDVNLYSLFVERAQSLLKPGGVVALLTPSGIAADKGASEFFKSIATTGRMGALFDFENRKVFFADVHASFKFCVLMFGNTDGQFHQTRCAFFLHALSELKAPERTLVFTADEFALVNPNTGAAPIFRSARDAKLTMRIYREHPVLVKHIGDSQTRGHSSQVRVWPIKFARMFDMTNDSNLFLTIEMLKNRGYSAAGFGHWRCSQDIAVPLYVGRMITHLDHRAANVVVNVNNLQHASLSDSFGLDQKIDPNSYPTPHYWVNAKSIPSALQFEWALAFRSIARPTDSRTIIAAILPRSAVGNSLPLLLSTEPPVVRSRHCAILIANMSCLAFDFCARQKIQGSNINWYIVEQLPVIAADRFDSPLPTNFTAHMRATGLMNGHHTNPTVADFVVPQVLALSYTAHDLAPFARDLGYVDAQGQVLPPFVWDDEDRRARLAALDALFFYLYGLDADDAAYVMDSFPIVRDQDQAAFGRYRTKDDVLALLKFLPSPKAH
jgi:Eco57I restriction-modification methylase